ncbi:hypothetical protein BDQ17DRAFT_1441241 [Cyathus striatus]|nr:hypothetical protein BDQ17DRAFT_1441241 [Cyathus striatus]
MPASRINARTRRRSSLVPINPAKAGTYSAPRTGISFAPNITPITYADPSDSDSESPPSPTIHLFPPSSLPAPPPTRKRQPPGKRRSQGYIPRPPNAFMLFRADFVRQKHVPGTIETNHGSLSKIIGNCWHKLPPEQKKIWDKRAKAAKEEHKKLYPHYRFKPVHNKNKKKEKSGENVEEERRCEEVAQLLLEGKKGDELAQAVLDLDRMRDGPRGGIRRPSSVPLPGDYGFGGGIALPSVPFLQQPQQQQQFLRRPSSAFDSSAYNPYTFGFRRPSDQRRGSAGNLPLFPTPFHPTHQTGMPLQMDSDPLPEADTSLFDPGFLSGFGSSSSSYSQAYEAPPPYSLNPFGTMNDLVAPLSQSISPLHSAQDMEVYSPEYSTTGESYASTPATLVDPESPWPATGRMVGAESAGSTAYSGSPEPLESLPQQHQVLAPVPVTPTPVMFDSTWSYEHPQQQQVDNDIYAQQGYMGYEAESYGGQEASQAFESLWCAPAVGFEYQDVHA